MNSKDKKRVASRPYLRLINDLEKVIAATPADEKLPSEPDLAKQLGVSRATLREAMRSFEGKGLIRRQQGIGTFVIGHPPVIESGMEVLESLETSAGKINLKLYHGCFENFQSKSLCRDFEDVKNRWRFNHQLK